MRKQAFSSRASFSYALPVIGFLLIFGGFTGCQPKWDIQNPYAEVDWENHQRFKANFHTHTTMSDGRLNPQTVVDRYHALGYYILALTDHNEVTYPWTGFAGLEASTRSYQRLQNNQLEEEHLDYENRDPQQMGMVAIQGNELSRLFPSLENHTTISLQKYTTLMQG